MRMTPETTGFIPNAESRLLEIVFIWLILPIPKEASTQNTAKRIAKNAPICLQPFFEPSPSFR